MLATGCFLLPLLILTAALQERGSTSITVMTGASRLSEDERRVLRDLITAAQAFPEEPASIDAGTGERVAAALREAARSATAVDENLRRYLETAAGALESGDGSGLEEAWRQTRREHLVVIVGPGTVSEEGLPVLHDMEVGLVDRGEHDRWVDALLARLGELERWLPLEPDMRHGAEGLHGSVTVANAALRTGTVAGSIGPGTYLPFDRTRLEELGRADVFWKNLMAVGWYGREVLPVARTVLHRDQHDLATARAHLHYFATRFLMYQFGPQSVEVGGQRRTLREHFGEMWGPLQIAKADTLAILAHDWLVEQGLQPEPVSAENYAMYVTMAFLQSSESHAGHQRAGRLMLSYLREREALAGPFEGTRWRIIPERMQPALRGLAAQIFAIFASGDVTRAQAFVEQYGAPSPTLAPTTAQALERSPWRVPVEFVVTGLETD